MTAATPLIRNPRYSLVRRLGGGAQAESWLATDTTTGVLVALKLTTLLRAASLKDLELDSAVECWSTREKQEAVPRLVRNSRLLKLRLQTKVHLQMCAMLSQVSEYLQFHSTP